MVGRSPAMLELLARIERVAPSTAPLVIGGETGAGKELVARAVHRASRVGGGPFVAVNCGAIPEELCESELFGHERGAFTGAGLQRRGVFEEADKGTLLLDEIGELPLRLQAKLLRALEEGTIRRVGASGERAVTVRVLAATHRDLGAAVEAGRFREDLFHRLATVVLRVPPLRERREDIPLLAEHFLAQERCDGRDLRFGAGVPEWLAAQTWPGNVRELRNAVRRAALLGGPEVQIADFALGPPRAADSGDPRVPIVGRTEVEILYDVYTRLLALHQGRTREVAAALGVARTTLVGRMLRVGVRLPPRRAG
jgi:DNA-binding NtrC family response regulator